MFVAEMRKIWKPQMILLMLTVSILLFVTFLYPQIKPFQFGDGIDSTQVLLELCDDIIHKYDNQIDSSEFAEIENEYSLLLTETGMLFSDNRLFAENNVMTYDDYIQYEQNAISGKEGYDYSVYSQMRNVIADKMGQSSVYYEVYQKLMQRYLSADQNRNSILPFETLSYSNCYFTYLIVLCLIITFFISAPVMVNDRSNNIVINQYSSKKGKRLYWVQYVSMCISVILIVSVAVVIALLIWKTTGSFKFFRSEINSFLNNEVSVLPLTYIQQVLYYIANTYLLTIGVGSIIFYLSSRSPNAINMFLKTIPVLFIGCVVGMLMQEALCESNSIYKLIHIPYCEFITSVVVFMVGIGGNIRNYKKLRWQDVN